MTNIDDMEIPDLQEQEILEITRQIGELTQELESLQELYASQLQIIEHLNSKVALLEEELCKETSNNA